MDALGVLRRPVAADAPAMNVFLACGFTPLHLQTFLAAHLRQRQPGRRVEVSTGLFGDLAGNLERLEPAGVQALAVVVEWADLDARLGVRTLGGWRPAQLADVAASAEAMAARLGRALAKLSRAVPTVVCLPTLPLPPMFWTPPGEASPIELHLRRTVAALAVSLSEPPGPRLVGAQWLDETSPPGQRFDLKSEVAAGFPYTLPHADALAEALAGSVAPAPPKKGLITDLDDTLWAGLLGEIGVNGVSWSLEGHAHLHGLYQQVLASLAGAGVLVGVASKNDPALAAQAFGRGDLLLPKDDVFPFEVHWSRKSESVGRILETWNVGADSVVFVDDSPMEAAEVRAAFPDLECLVFPKGDAPGVYRLLHQLRGLFGKPRLTEDDSLRLDSIRNAGAWRASARSAESSPDDFLRAADAAIVFERTRDGGDHRAFELVNKTNQFNLNGRRFTESEWQAFFGDPASWMLTVSYKDKFGPLGTIAVLLGKSHGRALDVAAWVMSCRAFSRRIEHQCLKYLFDAFGADAVGFDYQETPRNGPLRDLFASLLGRSPAPGLRVTREQFDGTVPALFHRIEEAAHV